jgi:hypothetical protein
MKTTKTEDKKETAFLHRVVKVMANGQLKVPGATVLKGAKVRLTKTQASDLNELLPGCVEPLGI